MSRYVTVYDTYNVIEITNLQGCNEASLPSTRARLEKWLITPLTDSEAQLGPGDAVINTLLKGTEINHACNCAFLEVHSDQSDSDRNEFFG